MDKLTEYTVYLQHMHRKPGADDNTIRASEIALGKELPADYTAFMRLSNGAEGMIGDNYISLWSVDKLSTFNQGYAVDEFAPGLLLFASDGGGMAYAFDTRDGSMNVVNTPFIGLGLEEARFIALTFSQFLARLSQGGATE